MGIPTWFIVIATIVVVISCANYIYGWNILVASWKRRTLAKESEAEDLSSPSIENLTPIVFGDVSEDNSRDSMAWMDSEKFYKFVGFFGRFFYFFFRFAQTKKGWEAVYKVSQKIRSKRTFIFGLILFTFGMVLFWWKGYSLMYCLAPAMITITAFMLSWFIILIDMTYI